VIILDPKDSYDAIIAWSHTSVEDAYDERIHWEWISPIKQPPIVRMRQKDTPSHTPKPRISTRVSAELSNAIYAYLEEHGPSTSTHVAHELIALGLLGWQFATIRKALPTLARCSNLTVLRPKTRSNQHNQSLYDIIRVMKTGDLVLFTGWRITHNATRQTWVCDIPARVRDIDRLNQTDNHHDRYTIVFENDGTEQECTRDCLHKMWRV